MAKFINRNFEKMFKNKQYKIWLIVTGCLSLVFVYIKYALQKPNDPFSKILERTEKRLLESGAKERIAQEAREQVEKKNAFFKKNISAEAAAKQAEKIAASKWKALIAQEAKAEADLSHITALTFTSVYREMIANPLFLLFSLIVSFPMYILMLIFSYHVSKYIFERLVMMVFVIFGVTFMVFTILYISPMDPATNILGQTATTEQIENFNRIYGLDKGYVARLFDTFKQLVTFNMGKTFVGNQDVMTEIMNKFPVTLQIAFWSLVVSVGIAIPSGIISAIKQYSSFDYIFMFIALIGLSVPNFWLALIMILEFSIRNHWLPATFIVGNWKSFIMPAFVLGTGLSASVARMTRSSMLEVKNSDYILTAKAKGLSSYKVVMKHILGNAMIPIVTVIGLQFGGMLGGSAVTEKSFNIAGLGSYIVDRQFIPDIPVVLAGVVYIAVVISIANLAVDILYAFLDPRIKSKMKNY